FAIEPGDPVAVLDEPPDDARHHEHHGNVEQPAPMPRHLRANRHPRRTDAEIAAQAPRDASHGMTATWSIACVSGNPNMRFMFCTAWPAAPFTRLSSTASTTSVCASMGLWTAMRHWFVPRTERVSGCAPAGSTSTNGSLA